MRKIGLRIFEVGPEEVPGLLEGHSSILSCTCRKAAYPKELKGYVKERLETAKREEDFMEIEDLESGKITRPESWVVDALLKKNKLIQLDLVKTKKDFGILYKGDAGHYIYRVKL